MSTNYICQCMRPSCRFRYPIPEKTDYVIFCPKCGSPTRISIFDQVNNHASLVQRKLPGPEIEVLFDNIRSAFNVGSMLRTSEAAGISFIHFCGVTPTPDHIKVKKTALGSEFSSDWAQYWDGLQAVKDIKSRGVEIWGLEISSCSIHITDAVSLINKKPILLILGNENYGIDPKIRDCCDKLVEIPMVGNKQSLNVAIAYEGVE